MSMKRRLEFKVGDAKNQKRFELLHGAVLLLPLPSAGGRGIEVIRREGRILDALESISTVNPDPQAPKIMDEPARQVRCAVLLLEQADFELLKKRVETIDWHPKYSRAVVDVVDWLSAAPEEQADV